MGAHAASLVDSSQSLVTAVLRIGAANITISLAWRAIDDHEVSGPVQACACADDVEAEI